MLHKSGFKIIPVILPCPTMQELLEDVVYVTLGDIPLSGGDTAYQWSCVYRLSLTFSIINQ